MFKWMAAMILGATLLTGAAQAQTAPPGLITVKSTHAFAETLSRLEANLTNNGQTIFARFDHAANAKGAGLELRPTTVIVFGNPKGGTPLMQAQQLMGIELPMKFLVAEDASGVVTVSYNDPKWLAERQNLPAATNGAVGAIAEFLANRATFATN